MSEPTQNDVPTLPQDTETVPASGPAPLPPEEKKKPEPKAEPVKATSTRRTYGERFRAFFLDKR